ncbi:MAG: DUF448 domain-containing protein [Gemmatimonadetes bacterium]|nr:DUF448 domain-containing protein [Gemmatimonadota bacterium]
MPPVRTCLGCRSKRPQSELIRFVLRGNTVSVGRTEPGRGYYVCPDSSCAERLERKYNKRWSGGTAGRVRAAIDAGILESRR